MPKRLPPPPAVAALSDATIGEPSQAMRSPLPAAACPVRPQAPRGSRDQASHWRDAGSPILPASPASTSGHPGRSEHERGRRASCEPRCTAVACLDPGAPPGSRGSPSQTFTSVRLACPHPRRLRPAREAGVDGRSAVAGRGAAPRPRRRHGRQMARAWGRTTVDRPPDCARSGAKPRREEAGRRGSLRCSRRVGVGPQARCTSPQAARGAQPGQRLRGRQGTAGAGRRREASRQRANGTRLGGASGATRSGARRGLPLMLPCLVQSAHIDGLVMREPALPRQTATQRGQDERRGCHMEIAQGRLDTGQREGDRAKGPMLQRQAS